MTKEELKKTVKAVITDAFHRIEYAYQHQCEPSVEIPKIIDAERESKTRLIFPRYTKSKKGKDGGTRISEQELRFAFVEAFIAYCDTNDIDDLYYSIETPTSNRYVGFSAKSKISPQRNDTEGRSGEFDLVIFNKENDKLKRACLIEFKAKNAGEIDHWKDMLKLKEEGEETLCYFIEVLKSYDEGTKVSLCDDKFGAFFQKEEYKDYANNGVIINVRCYALEGENEGKGCELKLSKHLY
jgi:hypothetical protein